MKISFISDNNLTEIQRLTLIKFLTAPLFSIEDVHYLEIDVEFESIMKELGKELVRYDVFGDWDLDTENIKKMIKNGFALFACPNSYNDNKSDCWKVINYARIQGKLVYVIFPDGSYRKERAG